MIGKVIPRRRDGRSSFHAVARYIAGVGHKDKCTYVGSRNLALADFPGLDRPQDFIDLAAAEMKSCAVQNTRVGNPILHVVMSWPHDEKPTNAQVDDAVKRMEQNFGLDGCQCVYGVHENTEHVNLHVVYNRVHTESYKAIKAAGGWTKKELEKTVREIELTQGWGVELSGKHYVVHNGRVVPTKSVEPQINDVTIPERARDFEAHTGEYSAHSIAIDRITPKLIKSAATWDDFHSKLAEVGARYQRKGSGAVIVIAGTEIKASTISKNCTLTKLEKRFGDYEEPKDDREKSRDKHEKIPEKDSVVTQEIPVELPDKTTREDKSLSEKIRYDVARNTFWRTKNDLIRELRETHLAQKKDLYETQKKLRAETLKGSWKGKGAELNFLRAFIAIDQARDRKELIEEHALERKELIESIGCFPSRRDWARGVGRPGNFAAAAAATDPLSLVDAAVNEKKKLGIFGLEAVRVAGGAGFRIPGRVRPIIVDTGRKIHTKEMSEEAVLATLQLAQAKWGGCRVHGNQKYVELCMKVAVENGINITNPELQTRMEALRNAGKDQDHGGVLRNQPWRSSGQRHGRAGERRGIKDAYTGRDRRSREDLGEHVMAEMGQKLKDVRKQIVDDVCDALEKGTGEWQKTWKSMQNLPHNAATGRRYNGGNALSLAFISAKNGWDDPRWCTLKQANEKGWRIQKGSKGTHVSYFEITEKENEETKEIEKTVVAKQFVVFNAAQINGISPYIRPELTPFEKIEKAERMLEESGARIAHGDGGAYYSKANDQITLPHPSSFTDRESYYTTALHELGHWTGHPDRLNRDMSGTFGSPQYAKEELVAELTSMFVGGETGLMPEQSHFDNHAAYISHWIGALKKDPDELFRAATSADKAANLILLHEHKREQELQHQQEREGQRQEGQAVTEAAKNLTQPTAPESSAENFKNEVKALGLIKDAKIYTNPNENGNYKGKIMHTNTDKGYSVQQVGKTSLVVHTHDKLECIPEKDKDVRIIYQKDAKAKVSVVERHQEKTHAHGR